MVIIVYNTRFIENEHNISEYSILLLYNMIEKNFDVSKKWI